MDRSGLEIQELGFSYPSYGTGRECPVLDGLEFSLETAMRGVILAGADAGKTTLSRIISGLVPRFTGGTLSGRIFYGGGDLSAQKPFDLMESIGAVFQNSDEQLISTRCDTEAAFALESLGISRPVMKIRVEAALELMGLGSFAARNPATLSGGEKKRLLLSCVAAIDPGLWILDEAFEELDHSWKTTLLEYLKKSQKTVLFLDSRWSHLYASNCSRFAVLRGGKISFSSDTHESPELTSALAEEGAIIPSSAWRTDAPRLPAESALRVDGISFSFQGPGSFSLEIAGLELEKGVMCSLLGKNGSGKSTLARILCGLLAPEKGSLWMREGAARRRLSREELGRRVGYMFQNPDFQIFLSTVREELALGLDADRRRGGAIEETIRLFNLPDGDTPPALMSYGARKRLQAATYYLLQREFLILDEIDSGLSYREYLKLLEALYSSGAGILLITHDRELAVSVSDRIILLEDGRIEGDHRRGGFDALDAPAGTTGGSHGA